MKHLVAIAVLFVISAPVLAQNPNERFCLAGFCIGDAMEIHLKALKFDTPLKQLRNPWCSVYEGSYTTRGLVVRDGMSIRVEFKANPKYVGQPTEHYYRLSVISITPDKPLSNEMEMAEIEKVLSRYPKLVKTPMGGWIAKDVYLKNDYVIFRAPSFTSTDFYLTYMPGAGNFEDYPSQPGCSRKTGLGL